MIQLNLNNQNSVIVVCGDVLHDKNTITPYSVNLIKDFFKILSDISTVIVIVGNHDCNINNVQDMNSLFVTIGKLYDSTNPIYLLNDNALY